MNFKLLKNDKNKTHIYALLSYKNKKNTRMLKVLILKASGAGTAVHTHQTHFLSSICKSLKIKAS
jgi:hypothetical protein